MYADARPHSGSDVRRVPLGLVVALPGSIWSTPRRHSPAAGWVRGEPARSPQTFIAHSAVPLMPVIHRTILTDQGRASPRSRVDDTRPPPDLAGEQAAVDSRAPWRNMNATGTDPADAGRTGTQDHRRLAGTSRDSQAIVPHRPEIFPSGKAIRLGESGRVNRPRTTTRPEPATSRPPALGSPPVTAGDARPSESDISDWWYVPLGRLVPVQDPWL
jgi:hypothetical protein